MSDCAPLSAPPVPLPPDLRADVAYRRARGASWEEIAAAFRFDPDALRRAAHRDPEFGADFEAAWDEAVREAEAVAVRRLRRLMESEDPKVALRAAEALVLCVRSRRRAAAKPAAPRASAAVEVKARPTVDRAAPRAVVMG